MEVGRGVSVSMVGNVNKSHFWKGKRGKLCKQFPQFYVTPPIAPYPAPMYKITMVSKSKVVPYLFLHVCWPRHQATLIRHIRVQELVIWCRIPCHTWMHLFSRNVSHTFAGKEMGACLATYCILSAYKQISENNSILLGALRVTAAIHVSVVEHHTPSSVSIPSILSHNSCYFFLSNVDITW